MARRTTSGHTAAPLNSRRIMTILPEGRVGYTIQTSDWARNCRSRPFTCQHFDFGRAARGDVALAPDVILTNGAAASAPLLQATRSVPVVFVLVADPVGAGFVDSLARPGGNATGFTAIEYGFGGKRLELLKEIAPGVTRAAVIRDPAISAGIGVFGAIQSAAS